MSYFLPYQQRWINDDSPLKLYEKSRRVGITYATSYRAVRKCLREKDGSTFVQWVSSRDELTAKEFVTDYVAMWAREANAVARGLDGQNVEVVDEKRGITAFVVKFRNGARICSISSNPLAFAGKGGDILIDEMDLHAEQETLYAMAYPCTTWGGQLEIVSAYSADGSENTEFARLCKEAKDENPKGFSFHRTTLDDAISEGFVEKVNEVKTAKGRPTQTREQFREQIRKGCINRGAFESQYLCIPNQARGQQLIEPSDLVRASVRLDMLRRHIESDKSDLSDLSDVHFWRRFFTGHRHVFGYDIGRTGDLTSIWVNRLSGGTASLAALITMRGIRFESQKDVVRALLDAGAVGCGDKTGLGMAVCEDLEEHYAGRFLGLNFASSKMQLGTLLQSAFEAGNQQIPLECPEVKADLAAIKKETTTAGRLILAEGRNELLPASHCDLAWSNALALFAAAELWGGPCRFEPSFSARRENLREQFDNPRRIIENEMEQNTWP